MSRIEQLISDIESYIDTCKYYPLSNVKIIVNKEQLEDMLTELRLKTPDEVKKYQKILSNKDAILAAAKEQADAIINAAQVQTEELINEHEIMQRAYAQANELIEQATAQAQAILDNATEEANSIRYGAMQYTDDMLAKLQYIIEHSIKDNKEKYDSMARKVIYTGPIDAYFDYCFGHLEYRSVRFETEVMDKPNFQGNAAVNYTDREIPWTRIIEHKWFEFGKDDQGNDIPKTVISKEY